LEADAAVAAGDECRLRSALVLAHGRSPPSDLDSDGRGSIMGSNPPPGRYAMAARVALATLCALALPWGAHAQLDVTAFEIVDLTHALGADTGFWPATPPERFELTQLAFGDTEDGGFYAANRFCSAEHGGTHLDAPLHFARNGDSTDRVPLERLVAPAVVIDVS